MLPLQSVLQLVDVALFGEKTIDVHAQYAFPVQHSRREPCFTTALNDFVAAAVEQDPTDL